MARICISFILVVAAILIPGLLYAQYAKILQLSQTDRAALEDFLGKGVVGKAVPGNPIADASKFFSFEDSAWTFRFTSGDRKDETQDQ